MVMDLKSFKQFSHYQPLSHHTQIHYVDSQHPAAPPTIAFHGNPTWSFFYRSLLKLPSIRLIAYDHLGMGLSDKPVDFTYQLNNHITVAEQFIDRLSLDTKINLIVHDWGGPIGLGWALKNRDRIHKIVICNTAAFYVNDIPKRIHWLKTPVIGKWIMTQLNGFAGPATIMAVHHKLSKSAKEGLLAPYQQSLDRMGIASFVEDIPTGPRHPSYQTIQDIAQGLSSLQVPILLLWGMRDFCFHPGFLQRFSTLFPTAQVAPLYDAGHYLFEDAPEQCVAQIAQFLS